MKKSDLLDWIWDEAQRQGYGTTGLSTEAGYSKTHLVNGVRNSAGGISFHAINDYLEVLGYEMVIVKKSTTEPVVITDRLKKPVDNPTA